MDLKALQQYGGEYATKLIDIAQNNIIGVSLLSASLLSYFIYRTYTRIQLRRRRSELIAQHGCKAPHVVSNPFGFTVMFKMINAARKHKLLEFFHNLFVQNGRTFAFKGRTGNIIVFTNDSENIKAMLATKFGDWESGPTRQEAVDGLLGQGIFTTDGAFWQHSRTMLRPSFEKQQITDLEQFERRIPALIERIPKDGSTVDLDQLFHQLSIDASTELLLANSTQSLEGNNAEALEFVENFERGMEDAVSKGRYGMFYYLLPRSKGRRAIAGAKKFVQKYVDDALAYKDSLKKGGEKDDRFVFLHEMAKHEEVDATRIRNEVLNILLAGRDTTASLLCQLFWVLAREPEVFKKLQAEVDELGGKPPSYDYLRNMKYLKHTVQEVLRLFPPVPGLAKKAIRDTTLPRGGGEDGMSPVFIPEGTFVPYNTRSMQRWPATWGDNAEVFQPERWEDSNLRPGWDFLPFGGGPRVCLGQQYALTEAYYVTVRLLQKFRRMEARDDRPWQEKLTVTVTSANGVKVGMYED